MGARGSKIINWCPNLVVMLLAVGLLLSGGCTPGLPQAPSIFIPPEAYELRKADQYISKIVTSDIELRKLASSIVQAYNDDGTKEARVNAIYRYIVENYDYISDPRGAEFVQTPYETIAIKGGDCEDLAILACSLLENLGIRTYLILTGNHAYALVPSIDLDNLWKHIEMSLEQQFLKEYGYSTTRTTEETFELKAGHVWWFGGDGTKFPLVLGKVGDSVIKIRSLEIWYSLSSSEPLEIYILPSKADWENLVKRKEYYHYPSCRKSRTYQTSDKCEIDRNGGIAIENPGWRDAKVSIKIQISCRFSFEDMPITYYLLKGERAIVLELTAGKYGYPGYSSIGPDEEKFAIDPVTKDYLYLR